MSAPLRDFLSFESDLALDQVLCDVVTRDAERVLEVSIYPAPAPEPMTLPPVVEFPKPEPEPVRVVLPRQLVRLKIDYVNSTPTIGEPCPCCARPLKYTTVSWPGGMRPAGSPEAAWFCSWCRQSYVYTYVATQTQKVS